jgi:hypothetical protein
MTGARLTNFEFRNPAPEEGFCGEFKMTELIEFRPESGSGGNSESSRIRVGHSGLAEHVSREYSKYWRTDARYRHSHTDKKGSSSRTPYRPSVYIECMVVVVALCYVLYVSSSIQRYARPRSED